jgi:hypothetical protein
MSGLHILAVDPGSHGAAVAIMETGHGTDAVVVALGRPEPAALANLRGRHFNAIVIEGQYGSGAAVRALSESVGRWTLLFDAACPGVPVHRVVWGATKPIGKAATAFLAIAHHGDRPEFIKTALTRRDRVIATAAEKGERVSHLKRSAHHLVAAALAPESVKGFIGRNGAFHDGACDAFALGYGAILADIAGIRSGASR